MDLNEDKSLEEEQIRSAALIYKKPDLTAYQERINVAATTLCVSHPSLLRDRSKLLKRARQEVHDSGYQYKKSRSRSFGVDPESTPKRPKTDVDFRIRRMKELEEDLQGINERISFKESRCQAGVASKFFKLCDQLAEEIATLKHRRRAKQAEYKELCKKEQKSKWYQKKVPKTEESTDDYDSVSSPQL